jgi:hypothetical protein
MKTIVNGTLTLLLSLIDQITFAPEKRFPLYFQINLKVYLEFVLLLKTPLQILK